MRLILKSSGFIQAQWTELLNAISNKRVISGNNGKPASLLRANNVTQLVSSNLNIILQIKPLHQNS